MTKLNKSEWQVIEAIVEEKRLPTIARSGVTRYKRHEKAIVNLKRLGVVVKDKFNMLKINISFAELHKNFK